MMKDGKALSQWLAVLCLVLTWPLTPIRAKTEDAPTTPDQQLAAGITVGKPQWLEAGGQRFLGIYTASTTGSSLGGAIILPSLGDHPNWPDVIAPLRKSLPKHGWSTLSIALPVPTKGSDGLWALAPYFTASRGRIQSAIKFMQQQGIVNIVLIGHGLGAAAAAVAVSGSNPLQVSALAAISLGVPPGSNPKPYSPDILENIHIPVLDVYGSRDFYGVTKTAAERVAAARRGGLAAVNSRQLESLKHSPQARLLSSNRNGYIAYRQMELMGADHSFRGDESTLIRRIKGWLKKQAAGDTANIGASISG